MQRPAHAAPFRATLRPTREGTCRSTRKGRVCVCFGAGRGTPPDAPSRAAECAAHVRRLRTCTVRAHTMQGLRTWLELPRLSLEEEALVREQLPRS